MSYIDELVGLLEEGNPIPDPSQLLRDRADANTYLSTLEARSTTMSQLSPENPQPKSSQPAMAWMVAAAVIVLAGVYFGFIRGEESPPNATQAVATTTTEPTASTITDSSPLSGVPTWLGSGNGEWVPARSQIPYAFTVVEGWNSSNQVLSEERLSLCPPFPGSPGSATCRLASMAVLFLDYDTVETTRDALAAVEGAQLGEERTVTIDGASGIRFDYTHEVAAVTGGQIQQDLAVPIAVDFGSEQIPLGQGPLGRSTVSIVDVDGVIVTLVVQGDDPGRGAPEDGFGTHQDTGLNIIDSIKWGTP